MIFETILTIVGMAALMNLIHKAPIYHRILEGLFLDTKPMNCVMCSTFWITLGFTAIAMPAFCIFIAAAAAILAELINIQIHKI
jgi:hypothetical protein